MSRRLLASGIVSLLLALLVARWFLAGEIVLPTPATPGFAPPRLTSSGHPAAARTQPEQSSRPREPRWGRTRGPNWDPEHWPSNKGDWNQDPAHWQLGDPANRTDISDALRLELGRLDCAIPTPIGSVSEQALVWGELETAGQRDLVVLCAHKDKTSATYVFWAGDSTRRETLPRSGDWIAVVPRAAVEQGLDLTKPTDSDMPTSVTHDGINIGCCDCCSTIYYRHRGLWFTLQGSD